MARWRSRSRLIRSLRLVLPGALGLLTLWVVGEAAWRQAHTATATVQPQQVEISYLNPKFISRDERGREVMITAAKALRNPQDLQQVELQDVVVTLNGETPDPVRLSAHGGIYREDDGLARLSGGVRIDDGRGNRFSAQKSVVNSKTGKFTADGGVQADGRVGSLAAGSYQGTQADGQMVFSGGVHVRINPH